MFVAYDPSANPLNNNEWAFPLTECVHIASMALSIGTIALVDYRMLGFGMGGQTPAQLAKDTKLWTLAGLVLVITSGLIIFTTDPVMYLYNSGFRFKMMALVAAILYHYTIHRKFAESEGPSVTGRLVAGVSLLLWLTLPFAGIFTAFV
jgi:hypothetical protein